MEMDTATQGKGARKMRVPWICKGIFWLAAFVFLFPGAMLLILHRFFHGVPAHASFMVRMLVSCFGIAIALVGVVPVLVIESGRGD